MARSSAIVLVWTPTRVYRIDPDANRVSEGPDLKNLCEGAKSAIVLVAHRGSIVRQIPVPNLPKDQVEQLLAPKLTPLLPAALQNYVYAFRLTKDPIGSGKIAIVGAAKADSLRKILAEGKAAGLSSVVALPSPFAAWLVAYSRGVKYGILLSREGADVCLDVIVDGELKYSRFTSTHESDQALQDEIERTAETAGVSIGLVTEIDPAEIARVLSAHSLEKQGLLLQQQEERDAEEKKRKWFGAQRALAAAILATGAWGYVLYHREVEAKSVQSRVAILSAIDRGEAKKRKDATDEAIRLRNTAHLINLAFDPAQTFGDMVSVLSQDSDGKSWITGLSLERGKPMTLRGEAGDGKTVSKLVAKLSKEPRFRDVKLLFAKKGLVHNAPQVQFAISGTPVGNLPFDREIGMEKKKK